MYEFENKLSIQFPQNNHIKDKIRQQLQILRDQNMIEFIGRGLYKKIVWSPVIWTHAATANSAAAQPAKAPNLPNWEQAVAWISTNRVRGYTTHPTCG